MSTFMKHSFREVSSQKYLNLYENYNNLYLSDRIFLHRKRETYQNWRNTYPSPGSSMSSCPCTCLSVISHYHFHGHISCLIVLSALVAIRRRVGALPNPSRLGTLLFRMGGGTSRWTRRWLFSPILPQTLPLSPLLLRAGLQRATSSLRRSARNVPLLINQLAVPIVHT